MKIYIVVGESGTYAEYFQWNVDAWVDEHLAKERVEQLKRLLTQLGWPVFHPRAHEAACRVNTRQFQKIIDRLKITKCGDPNVAWNGGELYINYTVEDLELHNSKEDGILRYLVPGTSKEGDSLRSICKEICSAFTVPHLVVEPPIDNRHKKAMRESDSDGGILVPEEVQPALLELIEEHKTIIDIRNMGADDGTI